MLNPLPRVVLVPGLGAVAAGTDAKTARANAEIAYRSHRVTAMTRDAFGAIDWLSEADVFDFDYWPLELAKLAVRPGAETPGRSRRHPARRRYADCGRHRRSIGWRRCASGACWGGPGCRGSGGRQAAGGNSRRVDNGSGRFNCRGHVWRSGHPRCRALGPARDAGRAQAGVRRAGSWRSHRAGQV